MMIMNDLIPVICINEPDISYTRNKPLKVNGKYWGKYSEVNLDKFGICQIYDIFDDNKNKLGQYYARDFNTIEDDRNNKLEELLNESNLHM